MLTDNRKHIQELAERRILGARSEQYRLWIFCIPRVNLPATDYIDLIDWQKSQISEPPILANTEVNDLEMLVASHEVPVLKFLGYPCHTQSVEPCVKLVTKASAALCGTKARDGFIRVRLESREIMPSFNTEEQYHFA